MSQTTRIYLNGAPVELNQSHYKGAGGFGTIYAKQGKAYKIYHDPTQGLEDGKIRELAVLTEPNILGPREPIHDSKGKPIGFWMPFVDRTEYLCKLFTKGFCDAQGITPKDSAALVARMQTTLESIHSRDILVVDYNEMNFLTDKKFEEVYYIDVDGYQTPHYRAEAIMASIRDPKVQNHAWSRESDWFSFGILACQLYIKTHPYKGRHPVHGKNWEAMMKAGVSIFNKDTRMPPSTLDLSVIPKGHRKWLERVMEHGERSKPPQPDQDITPVAVTHPVIVNSTASVTVTELLTADDNILEAALINGAVWVLTNKSLSKDGKVQDKRVQEAGYQAKRARFSMCHIEGQNQNPALIRFNAIAGGMIVTDTTGKLNERIPTSGFFVTNNRIFITGDAGMTEMTPINLGAKPLLAKAVVAQIFHQHTVLDGMVVQDILGRCTVTIPTNPGVTGSHRIHGLDGHRILSGKHEKGFAILISEHQGSLQRTTLFFDKVGGCRVLAEVEDSNEEPNFCVLDKGICVSARGDELEIFSEPGKKKVVQNSPIVDGQRLRSWQNLVLAVHKDKILQLQMK